MGGARPTRHLSTTVFGTILVYSIVIVLCFSGMFSAFFYLTSERDAESRLLAITDKAASALNEVASEGEVLLVLKEQFEEGIRYTLVDSEGAVLYDSQSDSSEDHSGRPEVIEAKQSGRSSLVRYSTTLGEDTIYAAVELDSGNILRLSERRATGFSVIESIAFPLCAALILTAALSSVVSRMLTRRIVSPLDSIDVSHPLADMTYDEMRPLLSRIDTQQQQLMEQNRELSRAEDMRREFSANVSHELKTPLQVIAGYAELLVSQDVPSDDVKRFAGVMADESQRMRTLIDDVLTLSRLDDPVLENAGKENVDLFSEVKAIVEGLSPLAEKRDVIVRVLGSSVGICGNPRLLAQLIGNIVSNAIRYSYSGGVVTVAVGKTLGLDEGDDGPEAYVRVRDAGQGIAEEDKDKIFERFYRVDKSRSKESGGTGLGLAIAKHAAAYHDAYITVDSELGKGSTFVVHFPLSAPDDRA